MTVAEVVTIDFVAVNVVGVVVDVVVGNVEKEFLVDDDVDVAGVTVDEDVVDGHWTFRKSWNMFINISIFIFYFLEIFFLVFIFYSDKNFMPT